MQDKCSCRDQPDGPYYTVISSTDCQEYTNNGLQKKCSEGLKFDLSVCVCNHASKVTCPDNCPVEGRLW